MATEFDVSGLSIDDLADEIEDRGFIVLDENEFEDLDQLRAFLKDTDKLYLDYMLTGEEFFEDQLHKFFNKYVKGCTLL